ncbi:hypothetical protein ACN6AT_36170 (plasmid) [Streptomyces sp. JL4002]|uniref:hypothetical protein n=1 Tax=Streptomyces sp. JL4002 TaxID=3404781 RepID=UPI003B285EA8
MTQPADPAKYAEWQKNNPTEMAAGAVVYHSSPIFDSASGKSPIVPLLTANGIWPAWKCAEVNANKWSGGGELGFGFYTHKNSESGSLYASGVTAQIAFEVTKKAAGLVVPRGYWGVTGEAEALEKIYKGCDFFTKEDDLDEIKWNNAATLLTPVRVKAMVELGESQASVYTAASFLKYLETMDDDDLKRVDP